MHAYTSPDLAQALVQQPPSHNSPLQSVCFPLPEVPESPSFHRYTPRTTDLSYNWDKNEDFPKNVYGNSCIFPFVSLPFLFLLYIE